MRRTILRPIVALLAAVLVVSRCFAQAGEGPRALAELVAAERAFAKYCAEHGVRESWLEFFADDGVIFRPGPVNAKEFYRARPATPRPQPFTLTWEPSYGDVSRAGDLGYNIGPWTATDNVAPLDPTEHGFFFSVWKRGLDGRWKVAIDFGTGRLPAATPEHRPGLRFMPARQYRAKIPRGAEPQAELRRLTEIDRRLAEEGKAAGALNAYLAHVSDEAKVFAWGAPPAGKSSLGSRIPAGREVALALSPLAGGASKSADMAYTYGGYELRDGGALKERGYYAHVWKRDESGAWKIVVMNFHPERSPR